jgi:hypothetical protein
VYIQKFNQNYSDVALALFRLGSAGGFGSPERTKTYVRKPKSLAGSKVGNAWDETRSAHS